MIPFKVIPVLCKLHHFHWVHIPLLFLYFKKQANLSVGYRMKRIYARNFMLYCGFKALHRKRQRHKKTAHKRIAHKKIAL